MKIINALLAIFLLSKMASSQFCKTELMNSYFLEGNPTPGLISNPFCLSLKKNCCTKNDFKKILTEFNTVLTPKLIDFVSKMKKAIENLKLLHLKATALELRTDIPQVSKAYCQKSKQEFTNFAFDRLVSSLIVGVSVSSTVFRDIHSSFYCSLCDFEAHQAISLPTKEISLDETFCLQVISANQEFLAAQNVNLINYLTSLQNFIDCNSFNSHYNFPFLFDFRKKLADQFKSCFKAFNPDKMTVECAKVCEHLTTGSISPIFEGDFEFFEQITAYFNQKVKTLIKQRTQKPKFNPFTYLKELNGIVDNVQIVQTDSGKGIYEAAQKIIDAIPDPSGILSIPTVTVGGSAQVSASLTTRPTTSGQPQVFTSASKNQNTPTNQSFSTSGIQTGLTASTPEIQTGRTAPTLGIQSGITALNSGIQGGTTGSNSGIQSGITALTSGIQGGTTGLNSGIKSGITALTSGIQGGTTSSTQGSTTNDKSGGKINLSNDGSSFSKTDKSIDSASGTSSGRKDSSKGGSNISSQGSSTDSTDSASGTSSGKKGSSKKDSQDSSTDSTDSASGTSSGKKESSKKGSKGSSQGKKSTLESANASISSDIEDTSSNKKTSSKSSESGKKTKKGSRRLRVPSSAQPTKRKIQSHKYIQVKKNTKNHRKLSNKRVLDESLFDDFESLSLNPYLPVKRVLQEAKTVNPKIKEYLTIYESIEFYHKTSDLLNLQWADPQDLRKYAVKSVKTNGMNPISYSGNMNFDISPQTLDKLSKGNVNNDPEDIEIIILNENFKENFIAEFTKNFENDYTVKIEEKSLGTSDQNIKELKPVYADWEKFDDSDLLAMEVNFKRERLGLLLNDNHQVFPNPHLEKSRRLAEFEPNSIAVARISKNNSSNKKHRVAVLSEFDGLKLTGFPSKLKL